jgi:3-phosphoshikimate 1-carboxyvinyltransferase
VNVRFGPSDGLRGTVAVPPDKSISHRAAILAAMAIEPVPVRNYLDAADTRSTLRAVQALGAIVQGDSPELLVRGVGLRHAQVPPEPIDVGNAGTLMRLLPGWLAFQQHQSFRTSRSAGGRWIGSLSRLS